ncbi:MAG: hypothetical protein Q9201_002004 [Fulgogasparrea decipioides]
MAKIMTFGYNSVIIKAFRAVNQSNIFSHARNLLYELESKRKLAPDRHLVFIVHSLGGIIVKEALRRSEVDPDPKINKIFSSTTGIFFFGTPHRGSKDWASFGEGITRIASLLLGPDSNDKIIHALLPSGPELDLCRESFITQWMQHKDRLTVRTFQESKAVTGRAGKLNGTDYMKRIPLPSIIRLAKQDSSTLQDITKESLEWFFDSPEFKSWISTDDSTFLWLHGPFGDGKTVVAMYTRQYLSKSKGYSQERDVASIFCSQGETEIGMVMSLASQLSHRIDRANAEQNKFALPEFSKDHSERADLTREVWELLEALIILLPGHEVVFILDGIDEAGPNTRFEFLHSLRYLEKKTRDKAIIRILISSRDFPDIRGALDHYSSIERGKEWKECLSTLRFEEWNARENKISNAQEGGTWLSSSKDYNEWLASPGSDMLWIAGKPGSGKSTLVKLIVKNLQAKHSDRISQITDTHDSSPRYFSFLEEKETIFASFYYSFRGGYTEMSHELMLRSIAYQIFRQNNRLFALIRDRFRELKTERRLWRYQDLKSILESLHDAPFQLRVFITVDGMDESDNALRYDVLEFLSTLSASKNLCIVKVLIASRPENDIRPWMSRARHLFLQEKNHEDIRKIVKSGIKKLEEFRRSTLDDGIAPPEPQDQNEIFAAVETYILANSRGVFLWVVLVLRELEILIRLGGYCLEDIDDRVRSLPKELGGSESFYAVMVERLVKQANVIEGYEARGRRIFAWVTFSTRPLEVLELRDALAVRPEHMEEANLATFDLDRARPMDLERGLSTSCGGFIELKKTDPYIELPLRKLVQLIHQTAREFLLGKDRLAQPYDMDENFGDTEIAASKGQTRAIETLLILGASASKALYTASYGGHERAVTMLLAAGADVNIQGGEYGNALQAASAAGHTEVVHILLSGGADINAQGGEYGNALQAASANGHENVVLVLLQRGADINAQGGQYGNALQAASKAGHEMVVQILNHAADINAQEGDLPRYAVGSPYVRWVEKLRPNPTQ